MFVAGKAPDGRRGRASAAVPPSCFREAVGATRSARRGGPGARLPVPGRLEEEGGGGRRRAGGSGARGARRPQRWDFSACEESGAGARPRRRSADSGAAGAGGGGGGEAAGKEEEGESRSRPASMGRLAPRPLLLALLSLGECARGPAGRGGLGQARGDRWGAAAARGLGRRRCRGHSRESGPGSAGGGARRGAGANRAGCESPCSRPSLARTCAGGSGPRPASPGPPYLLAARGRLTLNSRPGRCLWSRPASPARERKSAALICPAMAETGRTALHTHSPAPGCLSREARGSANFLLRRSPGGPERYSKNRCAGPSVMLVVASSSASVFSFSSSEAASLHICTQRPGNLGFFNFSYLLLFLPYCPLFSTLSQPWCLLIIWPSALPQPEESLV